MSSDKIKNGTEDGESKETQEFENALEESLDFVTPEAGQKLKGKIISISADSVLVDVGAKSEGILDVKELGKREEGDEIEATVIEVEPVLKLSFSPTGANELYATFQEAFTGKTAVSGTITRAIKGGFDVEIQGQRAFLPISHLDVNYVQDSKPYIGQNYEFEIIELKEDGSQFVVSRSALLKKDRESQAEKTWESLSPGAIVNGTVRSLQNFGAFIDIGGVEGLLHISELSKDYTSHPRDLLSIGDAVEVQVLSADRDRNRISLSMKDLAPDPWQANGDKLSNGDAFTGSIVRKADFGLFVQLFPGIDGLLHASQLAPGTNLSDSAYEIGKKVSGWIRSVDLNNKRVGLTLREATGNNPWQALPDTIREGAVLEGTVEECTQYGVFVELQPELTGLMPLSELRRAGYKDVEDIFKAKSSLQVRVTAVDPGRQRISLIPADVSEELLEEVKAERKKSKPRRNGSQGSGSGRSQQNNGYSTGDNEGGGVSAFGAALQEALRRK